MLFFIQKKNIKLSYDIFQFLGISHKKFFQYEKEDDSLSNFVSEMSDYIMKDNFTISLLDIFYRFFRYRPFSEILEDKSKDQAHKNISRMLELIYNFCQMETLYYIHPKNIEWFVKVFFDAFIGFICKENVPEFEEDTIIPDKNEISLITIHSSKGMEYPVVIMGSLWDRPYKNYESPFDKFLDEFLKIYGKTDFEPYKFISVFDFYRKYYTGFSRAKNLLILAGINDEKREDLIGIELRLFYKRLLEFDQEALDKLKEMPAEDKKVKDLYSYTQDIAQYNYCPRAYKFFRKLRFTRTLHPGMTYGSIIHETIEYINKSIIKGQKPNKNQITQKIKEIAKNKYKNGATFIGKNMLQSASKEIQKYYEHLDKLDQILDSELEISLVSEDYMIVGNVDMVYKKDQNINIIDFKTGLNPIKLGNKDLLNQYLGQLYLYANLYEKTKNEKIANVSLYFTSLKNDQQFIDKKLEDSHLQNSMKDVEKTIQQIEQDHIFEKTTDINKCKNCDLRFLCDRIDIDTH